ncbi:MULTISPECIES: NAD(P)/FAD-dependent oxidoreductase [unclassified Leucobacter]|uniref:NAD(P)/FAD-dependent oxidoreductase n=1 Tax=unclassified Leucobacter TaxID=2621730 RepID=UPI000621016C|nr:FAD-binding oxidoreductase [Leucobacter sp. Ag1]KKI16947.1 oxidase [Leucobacter sp. Ag1]
MAPERRRQSRPIIVVGAGIVGAAIASHLAREDRPVVVLDGARPGSGATRDSFAWVGLAKNRADVFADPLRQLGAEEFERLVQDLPEPVGLRRSGAITWEDTVAQTRAFVAAHRARGHAVELLSAAAALEREPALRWAPDVVACAPDDGGVDPVALTRAMLRDAESHCAEIRLEEPVRSVLVEEGRVVGVETDAGEVRGSTVVLAAGTAIPALAATAGVRAEVESSPCALIRFRTPEPLVRGILSTPDFEIRQLDDTTLIAAEDVPPGFDGDPRELAEPTLRTIREELRGGDRVELIEAVIADRPIPAGGRLLGFADGIDGLYLAAVHPAIMLAGAIGARVARDLA